MNYYKISKDNWSCTKEFATLEEAQAFADSLGSGYTAEYLGPVVPPTTDERLSMDIEFCLQLIQTFLLDNRNAGVTVEQGEALMTKFVNILQFAQTGAVGSVNDLLAAVPVDDVFTQERKDKYLSMISNYLSQYQ
tara:strand:- start:237 stop:641 length:405 start_codon:yes stop_codon:yes gene_type:complete